MDEYSSDRIFSTKDLDDVAIRRSLPYSQNFPSINISGHARVQLGDSHVHQIPDVDRQQQLVDKLSSSLYFPEILARYTAIGDEHEGTCDWILAERKTGSRQSAYSDWLKTDQAICWVSGKPGSGKSVLMRYLYNTLVEREDLENCLVLSFWFWEAGTTLEHSLEGCLRSLLWQCVQSPLGLRLFTRQGSGIQNTKPWTRRQLLRTLHHTLVAAHARGIEIKIFLDGVDESGSDAQQVIDFIEQLTTQLHGIKVCISSRPEQLFVETLSSCSTLLVHDLNREDINKVIDDDLFRKPLVARLLRGNEQDREWLRYLLQQKAQGVFLWVRLAIRNLLRGITNRDDFDILVRRLEALPDDLDKLYSAMLTRNENDMNYYRETAALYFTIVLHRPLSVVEFCLAIDHSSRKKMIDEENWTVPTVIECFRWEDVRPWINVRSGGLLEVSTHHSIYTAPTELYSGSLEFLNAQSNARVDFIHRTARTYLTSTITGLRLISECEIGPAILSDICFEVILINQYVLPGLAQRQISAQWPDQDWCELCADPSEATFVCAKKIWSGLAKREYIELHKNLETTFWPGEKLLFPSSDAGTIDYARMCCRNGWFALVQGAVKDGVQLVDAQYASVLLFESLVYYHFTSSSPDEDLDFPMREHYRQRKREQFFALSRYLKELGADLSHVTTGLYGEQTTFMPKVLQQALSMSASGELEFRNFIGSIVGTSKHQFECMIESMIELDCYMLYKGDYFLWGCYSMEDVCALTGSLEWNFIESTKPSRISVIVKCGNFCGFHGKFPRKYECKSWCLYGISEADSEALLLHLKQTDNYTIYCNGTGGLIIRELNPLDDPSEFSAHEAQDFVQKLCDRSLPLHSLPEALLYMGKTQEDIDNFVKYKEALLQWVGAPEEAFAQLRARFMIEPEENVGLINASIEATDRQWTFSRSNTPPC